MFRNEVTLFNYSEIENKYYPTLFENVEIQPKYKTLFTPESVQDSDSVLLLVKFQKDGFGKFVFKENGSPKYFLSPKGFNTIENKSEYFTLQNSYDFFVKGDFSNETEVIYEDFKNSHDEVFLIHSVKDFEDDLKHWEIEGT